MRTTYAFFPTVYRYFHDEGGGVDFRPKIYPFVLFPSSRQSDSGHWLSCRYGSNRYSHTRRMVYTRP